MLPQPVNLSFSNIPVPGVDLDMKKKAEQQEFKKDWSDSICDCTSDATSACLSFCVFPLRFALTAERAKLSTFQSALFYMGLLWIVTMLCQILSFVLPSSVDFYFQYGVFCLIGIAILFSTIQRIRLRNKFGIMGNGCEDCLYHVFLSCCALAQEARHVDRSLGIIA